MCQYFIPFYGWIIFHRMDIPHFVHPFICWWTLELFPSFWLLWIILLWTLAYTYLSESLLSVLLGVYLGVELLDHTVILYYFKKWQTFFHRSFTILHSHLQGIRAPISACLHQCLLFSFFFCFLFFFFLIKTTCRKFPGNTVVRTLCSLWQEPRFNPWLVN